MYVTIYQKPKQPVNLTFEDILFGTYENTEFNETVIEGGTVTRWYNKVPDEIASAFYLEDLIDCLEKFNQNFAELFDMPRHSLYTSFSIPKRSGGLRKIDAPVPELMTALIVLRSIFKQKFKALHHTSAFAYVEGRCHTDAAVKHQQNASNWFLKTDLSDFFGSVTPEFTMRMLENIFPFSMVCADTRGRAALQQALDLCFLDGGLPQGTPISPMLTNLIMIPIDHRIFGELARQRFVYTRYADDMCISCRQSFKHMEMIKYLRETFEYFKAPFVIKDEKTRYCSNKGENWILGVMLNKDNEITVGHMKKKFFKAAMCNFITDHLNGVRWPLEDVQQLAGTLSYYRSVEKDYFDHIIQKANAKFHVCFDQLIHDRITDPAS